MPRRRSGLPSPLQKISITSTPISTTGAGKRGKSDIGDLFDLTVGRDRRRLAGGHYIKLLGSFNVDILLYDPFVSGEKAASMGCRKAELEELLASSDIVSVHAPSIPSTYHMLNRDTIGLMKDSAVLINTARGSIIDEQALYEHMKAGKLKYACLDVHRPGAACGRQSAPLAAQLHNDPASCGPCEQRA